MVRHNAFTSQAGGPQGPLIGKNETYSFTFDQTGTYNYICQPHPNMKAVIEVVE
jgi:plastocyanin